MIDIDIQISISERSSGWATNYCRPRVGRSFLNSHGFAINLATTDKCSFCNKPETVKHFFFSCTKFKEQQTALFGSILQIFPDFEID